MTDTRFKGPSPADYKGLPPDARRLIEACDLVRANGYVVVSKVEHEMWSDWLRQASERCRRAHDEHQQAVWQVGWLMARCQDLLVGSRPMWWRHARRWWNEHGDTVPVQHAPEEARRAV